MKKILAGMLLSVFAFSMTGCSDDKSSPLAPPEAAETQAVEVKDIGYDQYVGGDRIAKDVANYYVVLSNTTCEMSASVNHPMPVADGDMLVLDLYGPASADQSAAVLPEGTYYVGFGTNQYTMGIDGSVVIRHSGSKNTYIALTDGQIDVTKDASGNSVITCSLIQANGKPLKYTFSGKLTFEDYTDSYNANSTLRTDVADTPFTGVLGTYYGNQFDKGTGNFVVNLFTDGFDQDMSKEGTLLTLCMFSHLATNANKAELKEGTYTVVPLAQGYGAENTLMSGLPINGNPFGTYLYKVDANGIEQVGYITSGTVEVKKNGNEYTFTYNLVTDNNKKITGTSTQSITFQNQSQDDNKAVVSNLEGDVKTDMSKVKEGTYNYAGSVTNDAGTKLDRYDLWLQAEEGDLMVLGFCTPAGLNGQIPDGTYKVADYKLPAKFTDQSVVSGHFNDTGGQIGTWYMHYEEGKYMVMDLLAPATEGTVTVARVDDKYTFTWDLTDDAPAKNKITGSWSGPIREYKPGENRLHVSPFNHLHLNGSQLEKAARHAAAPFKLFNTNN